MVIKREKKYPNIIRTQIFEEILNFPSCYANYCEDHFSCKNCVVKNRCKSIQRPKEPQWCNPD